MPSQARSTLSDFVIKKKIGSGSFGTVYKALRLADQQSYVIKTIQIEELSVEEQQEATNEVKLLHSIQSDFVVKYYDSFLDNMNLCIVMEYCDLGDLKGLLKKESKRGVPSLLASRTWSLFLQICLGLDDIHRKKILHRDMKTANVFLSSSSSRPNVECVKIGDMGVAKLLGTSSAFANTVVGTPYYLSPELCEDKPYNDKSDVWALGVILYECLTLKHPFEARNQCALILKIIKGKYPPVPDECGADKGLKDLLAKCLTHDSKKRPSVAEILDRDDVQDMLREHALPAPPRRGGGPTTTTTTCDHPSFARPVAKAEKHDDDDEHDNDIEGIEADSLVGEDEDGADKDLLESEEKWRIEADARASWAADVGEDGAAPSNFDAGDGDGDEDDDDDEHHVNAVSPTMTSAPASIHKAGGDPSAANNKAGSPAGAQPAWAHKPKAQQQPKSQNPSNQQSPARNTGKLVSGPSLSRQLSNTPQSANGVSNSPQFTVNGVGAGGIDQQQQQQRYSSSGNVTLGGVPTPTRQPNPGSSHLRGNRTRNPAAQRQVSEVAATRHQRPAPPPRRRPEPKQALHSRSPGAAADSKDDMMLEGFVVAGIGARSLSQQSLHDNNNNNINKAPAESKGTPGSRLGSGESKRRGAGNNASAATNTNTGADSKEASLPSTVAEEEDDEYDFAENDDVGDDDNNNNNEDDEDWGRDDSEELNVVEVQWEVNNQLRADVSSQPKKSSSMSGRGRADLFSAGGEEDDERRDNGALAEADNGAPLYEAYEPAADYTEEDVDLDATIGSEDKDGGGENVMTLLERQQYSSPFSASSKSNINNSTAKAGAGIATRQEVIRRRKQHVVGLGMLVERATTRCKVMLGDTAFDEVYTLFKQRFVDEDGRLLSDADQSEEKTGDMHSYLFEMQNYIVQRCGGMMDACSAVFNVQRLVALEAGKLEAERNLARALKGDDITSGAFATPRGGRAMYGDRGVGEDELLDDGGGAWAGAGGDHGDGLNKSFESDRTIGEDDDEAGGGRGGGDEDDGEFIYRVGGGDDDDGDEYADDFDDYNDNDE